MGLWRINIIRGHAQNASGLRLSISAQRSAIGRNGFELASEHQCATFEDRPEWRVRSRAHRQPDQTDNREYDGDRMPFVDKRQLAPGRRRARRRRNWPYRWNGTAVFVANANGAVARAHARRSALIVWPARSATIRRFTSACHARFTGTRPALTSSKLKRSHSGEHLRMTIAVSDICVSPVSAVLRPSSVGARSP